jgi:hypothetical protein
MKKTYTITCEITKDDKVRIDRVCDGFTAIELLGILEYTQLDILKQMSGEIRPDIVNRTVVEEVKP